MKLYFIRLDVPAEKLTYDAKLVMPDGWKFGTALPVENAAGNQVSFKPISLDLLVDSPVITGEFYRSIDLTPPGEPIHHEIDYRCRQRRCSEHEPRKPEGDDQSGG